MNFGKFHIVYMNEAGDGATGGEGGGASGQELLAGKFENQDALVKGYTELQTAFSGKDEAHQKELVGFKSPEEYTSKEEWGDLQGMNAHTVALLKEIGKEHSLPQGTFEAVFEGFNALQERVHNENMEEVVKSIPNYDNRSELMVDTASKYLREDQMQALDSLMITKEGFEAMEVLIGQLRGLGNAQPNNVNGGAQVLSGDELGKALANLDSADGSERAKVLNQLNSMGEGKLV